MSACAMRAYLSSFICFIWFYLTSINSWGRHWMDPHSYIVKWTDVWRALPTSQKSIQICAYLSGIHAAVFVVQWIKKKIPAEPRANALFLSLSKAIDISTQLIHTNTADCKSGLVRAGQVYAYLLLYIWPYYKCSIVLTCCLMCMQCYTISDKACHESYEHT